MLSLLDEEISRRRRENDEKIQELTEKITDIKSTIDTIEIQFVNAKSESESNHTLRIQQLSMELDRQKDETSRSFVFPPDIEYEFPDLDEAIQVVSQELNNISASSIHNDSIDDRLILAPYLDSIELSRSQIMELERKIATFTSGQQAITQRTVTRGRNQSYARINVLNAKDNQLLEEYAKKTEKMNQRYKKHKEYLQYELTKVRNAINESNSRIQSYTNKIDVAKIEHRRTMMELKMQIIQLSEIDPFSGPSKKIRINGNFNQLTQENALTEEEILELRSILIQLQHENAMLKKRMNFSHRGKRQSIVVSS